MTDLTKITTPFGLLDRETQEALKAHGGPYEIFTNLNGWQDFVPYSLNGKPNSIADRWHRSSAIRVKPAPPKPREWWLRLDESGDIRGADPVEGDPPPNWDPALTILVREVLE